MKKLSVILFVILFLAVAVLFFFQFSGGKKNSVKESSEPISTQSEGMVYVNIDTIIYNFDMFTDKRNDLLDKQQSAEAELTSKSSQYERGVKDYQDKVNKGLVTRATAADMEQALLQQQQDLVALRDQLTSDLMEEEQVMNRQVMDYITVYLEENKNEYNYQFILGKSFGGPVLYSDKDLDITDRVIAGLNKKYQSEKK